ncbi:hypothetical protein ACFE04_004696 [Oxalis oulophora]
MDDIDESLMGLICEENESCFSEDLVNEDYSFDEDNINSENEYVGILIQREIHFGVKKYHSSDFDKWVKPARLDALSWFLKMRALFGFHYQTVYLSITYFDRFLLNRSIGSEKSWTIRLLSVACLSLAVKMEEINIPSLSEYQTEEFFFHGKVIQRMELLVLNTLEWRMGSVTPFDYLHYFVLKLCNCNYSSPRIIFSRTLEFIFATIKDISLMEFRPSVIAAAATLVALDGRLTRKSIESMINSTPNCQFLEIEDVFHCYSKLKKLDRNEIIMENNLNSSAQSLTTRFKEIDSVLENSSISSDGVGNKRRKFTLDIDIDQWCHFPNDKPLC